MNEISIKFIGLDKTDGLESRLKEKLDKVKFFLSENDTVNASIRDTTPRKKTTQEYEVIIEASNHAGGKNTSYTVKRKSKDMYQCIDEAVDILKKQMSKNHQKSSHRFRHLKEMFTDRYRTLLKKGEY